MSGGKNNTPPSARLYVGSLGQSATQKDLEDLFSKHGKITEVRLNRNFAFVQFTSENEATAAKEELSGQMHFGRKLDVQYAKGPRNQQNNNTSINHDKSIQENVDMNRDRSPINKDQGRGDDSGRGGRGGGRGGMRGGRGGGRGGGFGQSDDSPFQSRDNAPFRDDAGGFRGGDSRPPFNRDNPGFGQNNSNFRNERGGGNFRGGNFRDNDSGYNPWGDNFRGNSGPGNDFRGSGPANDFRGPGNDFRGDRDNFRDKPMLGDFRGSQDRFGARDNFRDSPSFRPDDPWSKPPERDFMGPDVPPAKPPVPLNVPNDERVNDVEIVVMNKALTDYGEFIETRLKNLGLTVDLMFPNEGASLMRVLGNIASRGTLYAILVNPAHKVNRSLTLEILHGTPQEHRNILLDDALVFLNRNHEMYIKSANLKKGVESPSEEIKHLLEFALNGTRKLTPQQCDLLVQHFIEEKIKLETPAGQDNPIPANQQAELQTRILSILNKSGTGASVPPPATSAPLETSKEGASPLLKNPSVQKALDSLMQGGRFPFNQGGQKGGFKQF